MAHFLLYNFATGEVIATYGYEIDRFQAMQEALKRVDLVVITEDELADHETTSKSGGG